jgi:hypothetical protein
MWLHCNLTAMLNSLLFLFAFLLYIVGFLMALVPYGFALLSPRKLWTRRGIVTSDGMLVRWDFLFLLPVWMLAGTAALHLFGDSWTRIALITMFFPSLLCAMTLVLLWWRTR